MNRTLILVNLILILGLLLSACGGSVSGGIQLPGLGGGSDQGGGSAPAQDNTLIYVLIAAVVLVAVIGLLKK